MQWCWLCSVSHLLNTAVAGHFRYSLRLLRISPRRVGMPQEEEEENNDDNQDEEDDDKI